MPNFQAEIFFWYAEMAVARCNLAESGCGPQDEKVAKPSFKLFSLLVLPVNVYLY